MKRELAVRKQLSTSQYITGIVKRLIPNHKSASSEFVLFDGEPCEQWRSKLRREFQVEEVDSVYRCGWYLQRHGSGVRIIHVVNDLVNGKATFKHRHRIQLRKNVIPKDVTTGSFVIERNLEATWLIVAPTTFDDTAELFKFIDKYKSRCKLYTLGGCTNSAPHGYRNMGYLQLSDNDADGDYSVNFADNSINYKPKKTTWTGAKLLEHGKGRVVIEVGGHAKVIKGKFIVDSDILANLKIPVYQAVNMPYYNIPNLINVLLKSGAIKSCSVIPPKPKFVLAV